MATPSALSALGCPVLGQCSQMGGGGSHLPPYTGAQSWMLQEPLDTGQVGVWRP